MSSLSLKEQQEAAQRWWRSLQPVEADGRKLPGDRAALARLRRCNSVLEAAAEPATAKLVRALGLRPVDQRVGRAAILASLLAHVREDGAQKIAVAIGVPAGGEAGDALVKRNRFKALLAARTDEEVLTSFRRAVALLGRTANVRDLAGLVLAWTDDEHGDRTRTRFAFDYHGAGFAAPDSDEAKTLESKKD